MSGPAKIILASMAMLYAVQAQAADVILRSPAIAQAQIAPLPSNFENIAAKVRMRLTPRGANWVRGEVERLHNGGATPAQVESDATFAGGGMIQGGLPAGADIEELAFIVLMDATKSQDADLQSIMEETKSQNAAKQNLRNNMQTVNRDVANNAAQADKNKRDSMNEMSEMTSMRLQMAMDCRSKFVETLSNIMKKMSDTDNSITQNMK